MHEISNIYDQKYEDIAQLISSWGEADYRIDQIWKGLYQNLWSTFDDFTNLSKELRQNLRKLFSLENYETRSNLSFSSIYPIKMVKSSNGETCKTLFALYDGKQIESVLMRYKNRQTLCISTQAGCAMGCVFCATGHMGFNRQLSSGEIIEQVLYFARQLVLENERVTNIVMMGMGEPFHNYEATITAIKRLNDPHGFNLGARKFTISTVGIVPGIRRFTKEHSQINLSISLHAANDLLRSQLLPINQKYPLDQLFAACLEYMQETHRRLSFEWALIQGVNDTSEQANLLVERLKSLRIGGSNLCHVNVIPLNPTNNYHEFAASHQSALAFQEIVSHAGISCTIRLRRGIDIHAGCGQLAAKSP